jgi:hypothetical protein
MNEAGYTATEALAALAIIGLAMGGLTSGLMVVGRAQSAATTTLARADGIRTANHRLTQLFAEKGPFRSDRPNDFEGDSSAFSFDCGARRCGARIEGQTLIVTGGDGVSAAVKLPVKATAGFIYGGSLGAGGVWPPVPLPPPALQWQVLQYVAISDSTSGRGGPIAVSHLWSQQSPTCDFDTITQDCRPTSS